MQDDKKFMASSASRRYSIKKDEIDEATGPRLLLHMETCRIGCFEAAHITD